MDQLFGDGLDELARVAPDQPIIVAENASVESAGSSSLAQWIRDLVSYLDSWQRSKAGRICGFLWFNCIKSEGPVNRTVDRRFDSTPPPALTRSCRSSISNYQPRARHC